MKNGKLILILACALSIFFVNSCLHTTAIPDQAEILALASRLLELTRAVEGTVRYGDLPSGISEYELLEKSTDENPELLRAFDDYQIRVASRNKHVVLLVCTGDGRHGLLEDAGCTDDMDKYLWENSSFQPCVFTMDPDAACGQGESR